MGIPLAYGEIAPVCVPFRGQEPCHAVEQECLQFRSITTHGGCVMFAVPGFSREKKFLERMTERGRVGFKAVAIILKRCCWIASVCSNGVVACWLTRCAKSATCCDPTGT